MGDPVSSRAGSRGPFPSAHPRAPGMKPFLAALLLLAPVLSACDSNDDGESDLTITQTVVAASDLTTLEAAVIRAGLDDDLGGTGPFTVFAPTDPAFTALLAQLEATPEQLLARSDLAAILRLHVVAGRYRAADLQVGQRLTTLNGQTLTVVASGSGLGLDTQDAGAEANATITATDIETSNGVVHKIGSVLLPVAP